MASPNTTFTSGAILTAAQMNNLPFGVVAAPVVLTSLNINPTTVADITGATITFNQVTNRIYRVTYSFFANCTTSTDTVLRIDFTDTTPTTINSDFMKFPAPVAGEGQTYSNSFYFTGASTGSVTRKLRAARNVGAGTITIFSNSTIPFQFAIEDCGSV